jgi:hypothetical protein
MNELLVSLGKPGWCQVAVLRDGRLDRMYRDPLTTSLVGAIFKGRVDVIDPRSRRPFSIWDCLDAASCTSATGTGALFTTECPS